MGSFFIALFPLKDIEKEKLPIWGTELFLFGFVSEGNENFLPQFFAFTAMGAVCRTISGERVKPGDEGVFNDTGRCENGGKIRFHQSCKVA